LFCHSLTINKKLQQNRDKNCPTSISSTEANILPISMLISKLKWDLATKKNGLPKCALVLKIYSFKKVKILAAAR
jgi:hypothetical protein